MKYSFCRKIFPIELGGKLLKESLETRCCEGGDPQVLENALSTGEENMFENAKLIRGTQF